MIQQSPEKHLPRLATENPSMVCEEAQARLLKEEGGPMPPRQGLRHRVLKEEGGPMHPRQCFRHRILKEERPHASQARPHTYVCGILYQGSPSPRPQTDTDLWPLRNWVTQ